jgi:hypothetical protein
MMSAPTGTVLRPLPMSITLLPLPSGGVIHTPAGYDRRHSLVDVFTLQQITQAWPTDALYAADQHLSPGFKFQVHHSLLARLRH